MIIRLTLSLLLAFVAQAVSATTIEMKVNGLVCAFCAQGIEKTLRGHAETENVVVSLEQGLVALTLKPNTVLSDKTLSTALTEAGYTVTSITRTARSIEQIKKELSGDQAD